LAVELIQSVGPIPGYYTNTEHTRKWWKKEQFIPRVADRLGYPDEWRKKGKTGALDNAKERMTEILATHKVKVPLSQGQDEEIEKILQDARMYYKEKDLL
jgi:trimethylamine--corrinoid protein Co-methyltransferase